MSEDVTPSRARLTVFAIAAHPDDIEFMMAGTLLQLHNVGAAIHMWNLANGSCGTTVYDKEDIVRLRWQEAQDSAHEAGAVLHPPIADDLQLYYEPRLVARVAAVIRQVQPDILLLPSPQDYMEDHSNTCRLAVTGAFVRGMRNFATDPPVEPWPGEVVLYHALPHGLRDGLRRLVRPGHYVDISGVLDRKRSMLAQHRSQRDWLDASQGMGSYLHEMEQMARQVGRMSGRFEVAEGWRRHSNLGFAALDADPLSRALGPACFIDPQYERSLEN